MNRKFLTLSVFSTLCLAGCDDAPAVRTGSPKVHPLYKNGPDVQNIWIDDDTGCQYLAYGKNIGVVRYTIDGKPWCGLPAQQQRGRPEGVQP